VELVLACSVLAIGCSGVLAHSSHLHSVPAIVFAAWRMGISAVTLAAVGSFRRIVAAAPETSATPGSPRDAVLTCLAGMLLALHFSLFYAALHLTSVLRGTLFISLIPPFSGLLALVSFPGSPATRPPRRFWIGIFLAMLGVRHMVSMRTTPTAVSVAFNAGDALALLGAAVFAIYMRLGSVVRARAPLRIYQLRVTGVAAAGFFPLALALHGSVAVARESWPWLLAAALVPQLIGHAGFDYALRFLPPRVVATAILLEPVSASLLAWVCLGEAVTLSQAVGSVVVLLGVMLAASK